jgi:hypothetical protein
MDLLTSPEAWIALATLTTLEIVLGIDNIVFISVLADRLPADERPKARQLGLLLAMLTRILLLFSISLIMRLTEPLFEVFEHSVSGKDLILIVGHDSYLAQVKPGRRQHLGQMMRVALARAARQDLVPDDQDRRAWIIRLHMPSSEGCRDVLSPRAGLEQGAARVYLCAIRKDPRWTKATSHEKASAFTSRQISPECARPAR